MNSNDFYSKKRLNVCLNAVEMSIRDNGFNSPLEALHHLMHAFFDKGDRQIDFINVNNNNILIVKDNKDNIVFKTEVKQAFVDLLYPREKNERAQLPGQECFSFARPVKRNDDMSIEEQYAKDDYFWEERDR